MATTEVLLEQRRANSRFRTAKARGRNGGRPKALTDHQLMMAQRMLAAPDTNVQQVAEHFGVSRSTLYRLLGTTDEAA